MITQAHITQLILSVVYALVGMLIFGLGFWVLEMLAPFSIRKEIEEDQNTALAVIMGSLAIAIAIIIAAAIR